MDVIKVEVGGNRDLEGWENLGIRNNGFDIIGKELQYEDNSVDQFYWSHVIEHIPVFSIYPVLGKMYAKLRPGGMLRTVCPDLYAMAKAYVDNEESEFTDRKKNHWSSMAPCYSRLGIGGKFIANICNAQDVKEPGGNGITGGDENFLYASDRRTQLGHFSHVAGYDYPMLEKLFKYVGFRRVEQTDVEDIDPHKENGQVCVNAYK